MKKLLLSSIFAMVATFSFAQESKTPKSLPDGFTVNPVSALIPLTAATDFSITFTDGTPASLYTTLNAGNTVLLDFFYTDCGYCQSYAPTIDQAYVAHGSGTGTVKFWGIDNGDASATIDTYKTQYGVTNPCASGTQGGADAVITTYSANFNFTGYPTYSIVCPDKTVNWDVNYPPTAVGFDTYFTNCAPSSIDENNNPIITMFTLSYPSPANDQVTFNIFADNSSQLKIELVDITGKLIYSNIQNVDKGYFKTEINLNAFANGTYFVRLLQNDVLKDTQKLMVIK
jgi:hypothetical protein